MRPLDFVKALLDARFPQVCLVLGVISFAIATCPGQKLPPFKKPLPKPDRIGRIFLGLGAVFFLAVATADYFFHTQIAVLPAHEESAPPPAPQVKRSTWRNTQNRFSFVSLDLSAGPEVQSAVEQTFEMRDYSFRALPLLPSTYGLYLDDVHIGGAVKVTVFQLATVPLPFSPGDRPRSDQFLRALMKIGGSVIGPGVFEVGPNKPVQFTAEGKMFELSEVKRRWYLFSPDYLSLKIRITSTSPANTTY